MFGREKIIYGPTDTILRPTNLVGVVDHRSGLENLFPAKFLPKAGNFFGKNEFLCFQHKISLGITQDLAKRLHRE